jgi:hypothetical protein
MFGDDKTRIQDDNKKEGGHNQNRPPDPGIAIQELVYGFFAFFEFHKIPSINTGRGAAIIDSNRD